MREIKFRVWTGSGMEHRVVAGQIGAFYAEGLDPKDSACISPNNTIYSREAPIMQYTGIKDKNGKEIFEDDVVNGGCYNGSFSYGVIRYVGNRFVAVPIGKFTEGESDNFGHMVIIGNAWEHPELLEAK